MDSYSLRESILKVDIVLWKMSKYLQTSLTAMTNLAEGLCSNALLTLKVENSLICLVGT
jgi:predicted nucleotidyltransferase